MKDKNEKSEVGKIPLWYNILIRVVTVLAALYCILGIVCCSEMRFVWEK